MASPILSDADRAKVSEAVRAAEAKSAGEIVTILADRSDDYADVALAWSLLAGLLALCALALAPDFYLGIYDRLLGGWSHEWHPQAVFTAALVVAALKAGGTWLLLLWRPLRQWLTPRAIAHARVRERAISAFRIGAERRTHGRTGILIYLSMREHRAEIVADEAIASKVSPDVWGEAMAAMLEHIRDGRVADGMAAAVTRVGDVLALHLPRSGDDDNELPDRLIEV